MVANVKRTRRRVGVVLRESHSTLEVSAVISRVLVEHDQGDIPLEDVLIVKLRP